MDLRSDAPLVSQGGHMLAPEHWLLGAFGFLALLTLVFVLGGRMVTSFSGLSQWTPEIAQIKDPL